MIFLFTFSCSGEICYFINSFNGRVGNCSTNITALSDGNNRIDGMADRK